VRQNPASPGLTLLALAAAGGAVYYATRKKKVVAAAPVEEPPIEEEPPVQKIPKIMMQMIPGTDWDHSKTVHWVETANVSVSPSRFNAFAIAPTLPVDLIVSTPADYPYPDFVESHSDTPLLAGKAGESRDFIFRANGYAKQNKLGKYDQEEYNAIISIKILNPTPEITFSNVPMRIYVVPK
jgi:hypothetical protein